MGGGGGVGGGQTYTKQEAGGMFTSLQDSVTLTSSVCLLCVQFLRCIDGILKLVRSPGIDSKESISPGYGPM